MEQASFELFSLFNKHPLLEIFGTESELQRLFFFCKDEMIKVE